MKASDLTLANEIMQRRKRLIELIAGVPAMAAYALEMKSARGVIVFSNDQPGAQFPLSANLREAIGGALTDGLFRDLAATDSELKALGVEPPDDDADADSEAS